MTGNGFPGGMISLVALYEEISWRTRSKTLQEALRVKVAPVITGPDGTTIISDSAAVCWAGWSFCAWWYLH